MNIRSLHLIIVCLSALNFSAPVLAQAPAEAGIFADRILINGNILTVDDGDSIAEALAIRGGKIIAVGSNEHILALLGPGTDQIDLGGLTVTPGLMDAHAHFSSSGLEWMRNIDLSYPGVKNIHDIQVLVQERIPTSDQGGWIVGNGWDEGKLAERRYIYAADLDSVSGDRPVWLVHTMGHYGTANSAALKLAGITRETPDPPGGVIDRDPDGNPTGVLKESAQGLVSQHVPAASPAEMKAAMAYLSRAFNSECMTAAKDPGIGYSTAYNLESNMQAWDAYRAVLADGDLNVRIFALWPSPDNLPEAEVLVQRIGSFTRPYEPTGDDRLISGGIKLFADGSGGARTAWVWQDWNRERTGIDEGNTGFPAIDAQVLKDLIRYYHDQGLNVGVHAIGDRAIDWTVAAITLALIYNPKFGLRHSIIHANIPTGLAMDTMAALQTRFDAAYPEPSPGFTWWIGDTYAGNFGEQRSLHLNPFRTFQQKGIKWASGSDFNVTPFPARYGIWASMARQPALGVYGPGAFGQSEAVDIQAALRSYTIWAAHQMFLEKKTGSLEVGKYADIAVWNIDPYSAEPEDIKEMQCQMTLLEGDIVYRRDP